MMTLKTRGAILAILALFGVGISAQTPAAGKPSTPKKTVSRTPWGDPDLQGIWTSDSEMGVPFERAGQYGSKQVLEGEELDQALEQREEQKIASAPIAGGETGAGPTHWFESWAGKSARTSFVVDPPDGRVPALTAEAMARQAALAAARAGRGPADSYEDRALWDRCITRGVPNAAFPTLYNNNERIVQGPGYVVIMYEMVHEARIVPLDGRPHVNQKIRAYEGDSRGHFEGDTLVVDTTNFHPGTNYRGSGATLHLIERFTRVAPDRLQYDVTVDDPHTFVRPWTARLNLTPQTELFEYGCHEGNYAMKNILSGARADERNAKTTVQGRGEE
jgi:hypothetical protein